MRERLPLTGRTLEIRTDPDGNEFFYAKIDLDEPLDVVLRSSAPGERPHFGMRDFAVEVYVADSAAGPTVDLASLEFIAIAEIDDNSPSQDDGQSGVDAPSEGSPERPDQAHGEEVPATAEPSAVKESPPNRVGGRPAAATSDRPPRRLRSEIAAALDIAPRMRWLRARARAAMRTLSAHRSKVALALGISGALVIVGLAVWALWPAPGLPDSPAAQQPEPTATLAPPTAEATDELYPLLPRGYPLGTCTPAAAPEGARAKVSCGRNVDPTGPLAGTYTLAPDRAVLETEFRKVVDTTTQVTCPGNIQSPGPWRRKATRDKTEGTLFCGISGDWPLVAWTDEPKLLLSVVKSGPAGPNLEQLYSWWASHS